MKESKIVLGTWSWGSGAVGGDQVFGNHLELDNLKPVFDAAMQAGLNMWDTATVYGMGASESILGELAKAYPRQDVVLSTKFTPQMEQEVNVMFENILKLLQTDYIDMYWIHNPADVERWTPGLIPLLQNGKVKRVGVSNHNLAELKRAEEILSEAGFHVSAVQNHFSLLYRSSERGGVLDYCKEHGIQFWGYMVLEQGALSGKYNSNGMKTSGEKYDASVSQVGIAWAIAKGVMPIIGATKPKHVLEAAEAAMIKLTNAEVKELEALAAATGVDTRGSWEHPMD